MKKDEPLLNLDNITVTNHQGGATVESYIKAPEMVLYMLNQIIESKNNYCSVSKIAVLTTFFMKK